MELFLYQNIQQNKKLQLYKISKGSKYAAINAYLVGSLPTTKVLKFFGVRSITQLEI